MLATLPGVMSLRPSYPTGPSSAASMSAPPAPPSSDAHAHAHAQAQAHAAQAGSSAAAATSAAAAAAAAKKQKLPRNMQRRANHSQIERRRREKINDCLVTLCTIVPACVREVEQRKRAERGEEEAEAGQEGGKRKRSRRKEKEKPKGDEGEEQELGLHKLEVLTHAIEYIYDLQSRLTDLERRISGARPFSSPAYASLPSYGASGIAASLTSPIMSLSAESPILRRNGSNTGPNASPMWPMLPSSVLPLPLHLPQPMAPPRTRGSLDLSTLNSNSSFSSYIAPSPSGSALGGGGARRTADAELLLSFSTSPDALRPLPSPETMRPTSAVRSPRGGEEDSLSPGYTLSPRI